MAILEEEKKRFFKFLDFILKQDKLELTDEDAGQDNNSDSLKEKGDDDMPDSKILEDVENRIKLLTDSFELKSKELEVSYNKKLEDTEKRFIDTHSKELEASNKRLEEAEKRLSEKDSILHRERVERVCNELAAKGIWPSVVEKAKIVMFEDIPGKFVSIKLDDKTEKTLSDIVVDMLEAIPVESRISFEEVSHTNKNTDPNKKFLSEDEVKGYAKEKGITYQDACSVLAKEGKIEI